MQRISKGPVSITLSSGRQNKYPFQPSMRRNRPLRQKPLCQSDALRKLIARVMQTNVADAERLREMAESIIRAKTEAAAAIHRLDRVTWTLAEQIEHCRPIVRDLVGQTEEDDQETPSGVIYRKLREVTLRKLPENLLAMLLGQPHTCPLCGRR